MSDCKKEAEEVVQEYFFEKNYYVVDIITLVLSLIATIYLFTVKECKKSCIPLGFLSLICAILAIGALATLDKNNKNREHVQKAMGALGFTLCIIFMVLLIPFQKRIIPLPKWVNQPAQSVVLFFLAILYMVSLIITTFDKGTLNSLYDSDIDKKVNQRKLSKGIRGYGILILVVFSILFIPLLILTRDIPSYLRDEYEIPGLLHKFIKKTHLSIPLGGLPITILTIMIAMMATIVHKHTKALEDGNYKQANQFTKRLSTSIISLASISLSFNIIGLMIAIKTNKWGAITSPITKFLISYNIVSLIVLSIILVQLKKLE